MPKMSYNVTYLFLFYVSRVKQKLKWKKKVEFIHESLTQKYTITELCRSFNISRPTAYKLVSRFEKMGLSGLIEQERAPINLTNRTDHKVEESILKLKNKHML
jgi:transposase-like protein